VYLSIYPITRNFRLHPHDLIDEVKIVAVHAGQVDLDELPGAVDAEQV